MKTVMQRGCAEQTIEKSRFIAYVAPAESKEEADAFIAEIRAKHKDATHNVPAMVIGDKMQIQWGSDDGEPGGTSGTPMAQLLAKEGITNTVVVVTRYFGGIKLGPGGLVRAYTSSCKLGLEAAGICELRPMKILVVEIDYSYLAKLQSMEKAGGFEIAATEYGAQVRLRIATELPLEGATRDMLANLTGASAKIIAESVETRKVAL